MKTATIFYLTSCPYCVKGRKALTELQAENPAYAAIGIQWIEESQNAALADTYDYYSVPSIFDGKQSCLNARPPWATTKSRQASGRRWTSCWHKRFPRGKQKFGRIMLKSFDCAALRSG